MSNIPVKGVHKVTSKGRVYFYAWRGGPRLPGEPGSREFIAALDAALGKPNDASKLTGLIRDFKASDAYTKIADSTKRNWGPWLDRIADDLGKFSIKTFDKPEIRQVIKKWRGKWKDKPRAADMGKQVLSALLSYAVEEGRLGSNPCFGISNLYSSNRADIIWTPDDMADFQKVASKELWFALRLAALTGLRQGDLLELRWDAVDDLAIVKKTGKSKGKLEYVVPLYDELRTLLDEIRNDQATRQRELSAAGKPVPLFQTILVNSKNREWAGFNASWSKAMTDVEEATGREWILHFHDARGTAATKFYLAGFSAEDIAEILGWEKSKVEGIIDRYVNRASRLKEKIRKLGQSSSE